MRLTAVLSLLLGLSLLQAIPARASTDNDFQQWSLIFANHHLTDIWSASIQMENRLRDDASEVDKQIFKPGGYYAFTDTLKLGVGWVTAANTTLPPRRRCALTPPATTGGRYLTPFPNH